jgi:hypothetical protein
MHSPAWISDGTRFDGGGTARDLGVKIYVSRPQNHERSSNASADFGPKYFEVVRNPTEAGLSETARLRTQHEASRLAVLHRMGLAESAGGASWLVRRDCEQVLRAMQRTSDRQKTLAIR